MDTVWNLFSYGFIEWGFTPLDFQLKIRKNPVKTGSSPKAEAYFRDH